MTDQPDTEIHRLRERVAYQDARIGELHQTIGDLREQADPPGHLRRLMDANQQLREQVDTLRREVDDLDARRARWALEHEKRRDELAAERASRQAWAEEAMRLDHAHDEAVKSLREEIGWQKHAYRDGTDKQAIARTIGMEDALRTVEETFSPPQCGVHTEPPDETATPDEWSKRLGIQVMDPDGWRRDGKPWGEPVSEAEFRSRAAWSSVIGPVPGVLPEGGAQ